MEKSDLQITHDLPPHVQKVDFDLILQMFWQDGFDSGRRQARADFILAEATEQQSAHA